MTRKRSVVVIGGGPAGMAAAIEAARAGLAPLLIDEAPRLGGQVYRSPPEAFRIEDPEPLGRDFARGERLRAEFAEVADRVELLSETSVLGVWPNRELLWARQSSSGLVRADKLIIAAGARDRPLPFPGWTLPGVMTAGGVQTLLKTMRVLPGRRALVAGTGPLIIAVARRLHDVGVEVACVLEAGDHGWLHGVDAGAAGKWEMLDDTQSSLAVLRRAGIPVLLNHTVFNAVGDDEVEAATYGPVEPETWRPKKSESRRTSVDLVVSGFGFVPNTELTELAGCRHDYIPKLGGWVPQRDRLMQTTVRGLFAAGDGAGIGGVDAAHEEGRIAGITAAEQAGAIIPDEAERRRKEPLERLKASAAVRAVLASDSCIRPGLLELVTPETLACRCEEVSFSEVEAAVHDGAKDLHSVKLLTRLGMGPCQGRNCAPHTGLLLCRMTGCAPAEAGRINPRPPAKPVTLGALAAMEGASCSAAVDPLDAVGGGAS